MVELSVECAGEAFPKTEICDSTTQGSKCSDVSNNDIDMIGVEVKLEENPTDPVDSTCEHLVDHDIVEQENISKLCGDKTVEPPQKCAIQKIEQTEVNDTALSVTTLSECDSTSQDDQSDSIESAVPNKKPIESTGKQKWKMKIRVSSHGTETIENTPENDVIDIMEVDELEDEKAYSVNGREKRKVKRKYNRDVYSTDLSSKKVKANSPRLTPLKPKGGLRSDCPPFCKSNCTYTHNPLLVFARRMKENDSNSTLTFIENVADYYGGSCGNMKPSDQIHDPWRNTRFPLLHYIALMGKCSGCFALIDAGHDPKSVVTDEGETVLHTLIKEMYIFNCTHGHMDILLKKFNLLLFQFKSCIVQVDSKGKTPIHICAQLLANTARLLSESHSFKNKPPFRLYQFQKNMMMGLLEQFQTEDDKSMLNEKDHDGNTVAHYLATDRASSSVVESLKELGADFSICDNDGRDVGTLIDVAPPAPSSDILELAEYSAKGKKYKSTVKAPKITSSFVAKMPKASSDRDNTITTSKSSPKKIKVILTPKKSERLAIKAMQKIASPEPEEEMSTTEVDNMTCNKYCNIIPKETSSVVSSTENNTNDKSDYSVILPEVVVQNSSLKTLSKLSKKMLEIDSDKNLLSPTGTSAKLENESSPSTLQSKPLLLPVQTTKPSLNEKSVSETNHASEVTSTKNPGIASMIKLHTLLSPESFQGTSSAPNQKVPPTSLHSLNIKNPSLPQGVSPTVNTSSQEKVVMEPRKPLPPYISHPQNHTIQNNANVLQPNQVRISNPLNRPNNTNRNLTPQNSEMILMKTPDGKYMSVNVISVSKQNGSNIINSGPHQIRQPQQPTFQQTGPVQFSNGPRMILPHRFATLHPNQSPVRVNGQWLFTNPNPMQPITQVAYPQRMNSQIHLIQNSPTMIQNQNHNNFYCHNVPRQSPPLPNMPRHSPPSPSMPRPSPPASSHQRSFAMFPTMQRQHAPYQPAQHALHQPPQHPPHQPPQHPPHQPPRHPPHQLPQHPPHHPPQHPPHHPLQQTRPRMPAQTLGTKKAKSLEASIKQIQDRNYTEKSDNNSNPRTMPGGTAVEENAPPVFIIDTDDELNSSDIEASKGNISIRSPTSLNNMTNIKEAKEGTITQCSDMTPCKFQVEVSSSYCSEFERYLIEKKLCYDKIECAGHDALVNNYTSWIRENDDSFQSSFDKSAIYKLVNDLKDWFREHESVSLEEFAQCVLTESPVYMSSMLNMRLVPTTHFEEDALMKIERFLNDKSAQEKFIESSKEAYASLNLAENSYGIFMQNEINELAEKLEDWINSHPNVSQGNFAKKILHRSQGTISNLLRWRTVPTSNVGESVWLKIRDFLENPRLQEQLVKHGSIPEEDFELLPYTNDTEDNQNTENEIRPNLEGSLVQSEIHSIIDELGTWLQYHEGVVDKTVFAKRVLHGKVDVLNNILQKTDFLSGHLKIIKNFLRDTKHQEQLLAYIRTSSSSSASVSASVSASYSPPASTKSTIGKHANNAEGNLHPSCAFAGELQRKRQVIGRLRSWFSENPFVTHLSFTKMVLSIDENEFLTRNLFDNISEKGMRVIPLVEEFLMSIERQNLLRKTCFELDASTTDHQPFTQEDIHNLSDRLKEWFYNHQYVSQSNFARKILDRSQGTVSNLLRWSALPWSKVGEEVWMKIKQFLENREAQENLIRFCLDEEIVSSTSSLSLPIAEQQEPPPPPPDKRPCLEPTTDQSFYKIKQRGVNTLAYQLKNWLYENPSISQVRFAKHVLQRAQGTLSQLLKMRSVPTSRTGEKVWLKIKEFLNDKNQQDILLNECGGPSKMRECTCHMASSSTDTMNTPSMNTPSMNTPSINTPSMNTPSMNTPSFEPITTNEVTASDHGVTSHDITNANAGIEIGGASNSVDVVLDKRTIYSLVHRLRAWFNRYPFIRQGFFAKKVLSRSQGTLSSLLKWKGIPTSKSGQEVWLKIHSFLEESKQQQDLISEHQQTRFRGSFINVQFDEDGQSNYDECKLTQEDLNSISSNLKQWLQANPSVSQVNFAKHIIQLQQGTLSDIITSPAPPRSPHRYDAWMKIRSFLQNEQQQNDLIEVCSCSAPSEDSAMWARKELSILDEFFLKNNGIVDEKDAEMLANTFNKSTPEVRSWFSTHQQRVQDGLYRPGMYSIPHTSDLPIATDHTA